MRTGTEVCHRCRLFVRLEEVLVTDVRNTGFGLGSYPFHEVCLALDRHEERERRGRYAREAEAAVEAARLRRLEEELDLAFRRCRHGDDERECPTCEEILADGRAEMNRERWERDHPEAAAESVELGDFNSTEDHDEEEDNR